MAQRTIKNIEKEMYPVVGKLIKRFPALFKHTEMIGIFEGTDICSSFLINSHYCRTLTFYENLEFTNDDNVKNQFLNLYKDWESTIPNLKVKIENGNNFVGNSTFTLIDTTISLPKFIEDNKDKLIDSWSASPGWGINFACTSSFVKLVSEKKIFPVLIHKDYFFYCYTKNMQQRLLNILENFIKNNLQYKLQRTENVYFYEILEHKKSGYFERVKNFQ
jgi:hypothetical protein